MKILKHILLITITVTTFLSLVGASIAQAQEQPSAQPETREETVRPTVLPDAEDFTVQECQVLMNLVSQKSKEAKNIVAKRVNKSNALGSNKTFDYTDILGCGIKTGDIPLWMVVFYIRWVLEFIIAIAGIVTVGGMIYGGYLYLFAGLSDDKDKGKNAIKNSAIGLILTLTAWGIVNVVISLVSS